MAEKLDHRGPDSSGTFIDDGIGITLRRLSIIDPDGGDQPIYSEDGTVVLICNGEIFNHPELRRELARKGHRFRTGCDVEVLVHLYEEEGVDLLKRVNGQFAFAIYDRNIRRLFIARDHLGILPMYYARAGEDFVFGSEIKSILEHPGISRTADLTGLDQVLTFPGPVSPRTMFRDVSSLENGHYLLVDEGAVQKVRYWDLEYPIEGEGPRPEPDEFYIAALRELLTRSVGYRQRADVPVGYYLSGGLDSGLITALAAERGRGRRLTCFSVAFKDHGLDESGYQRLMADKLSADHHQLVFGPAEVGADLRRMVYHAECPVKETFNTCSLALSEKVRDAGFKVVLTGEGADELFGGYIGYRFDSAGRRGRRDQGLDTLLEDEVRRRLWGDSAIFYEKNYHAWAETKNELYSPGVQEAFPEFDCLNFPIVDQSSLQGRHPLHQRSYLDFKLRLTDHLLADHGDRMALANSVETRYPFLDIDVVEFTTRIPPMLKVKNMTEKYVLKRVAQGRVPAEIIDREKFGFRAPSSPALLRQNNEWTQDMLSYSRIARQGYFDPDVVEALKSRYRTPGSDVHPHLGDDLLLIVLTFGILMDEFGIPSYS
ncbi:asparagine synthase (glutamine-hydrolyzing) [Spinactinospora alkalitolerans]|uniref:asparagine synthase (glutamine-hydrolyzing) n=2 Tax=Spinactinospora alkalitolerans TaxID=687207 RepID=A0A852TXI7_9ACTN|nr:asparagine synthase (glutamine-hydrolyzing) [Spinactinospora alkalitolerans]